MASGSISDLGTEDPVSTEVCRTTQSIPGAGLLKPFAVDLTSHRGATLNPKTLNLTPKPKSHSLSSPADVGSRLSGFRVWGSGVWGLGFKV